MLGATPDEVRFSNRYREVVDEFAEAVNKLAAHGATLDQKLYEELARVAGQLKTRVYEVREDGRKLAEEATGVARMLRFECLGGCITLVGDDDIEYVYFESTEEYPTAVYMKIRDMQAYAVLKLHVNRNGKALVVVHPEYKTDQLDIDVLGRLLSSWREVAERVLRKLATSGGRPVEEAARLWLDILGKLGDLVAEIP